MEAETSFKEMVPTTPRRSSRIPHKHTPRLSDRKKGLFQSENEPSRESLTIHRKLPVVDSESDSDDCGLGIISTLDSSSDENELNTPKTPESNHWHETRSQTRKLLRESHDFKNFMKSPFTLKKYQNRYSYPDPRCQGSVSTPVTPHFQNHPGTPSSTHSCTSVHTHSSTSSRARKSLASLIADTESCSSSLKDLNFDTDSSADSKENTPTKSVRRSKRTLKMTPKFQSFKGILHEQKKNVSPMTAGISPMKTAVVCLTKIDMSSYFSPTRMLKTPQNTTEADTPPKLSHNRRSCVEISESPESTCDSDKTYKRLRNESFTECEPSSKYPRLENAPKARLSLFNSDRLKEMLSAKSFYGKKDPEMNTTVTTKLSNAIEASTNFHKKSHHSHTSRPKRKLGQINLGVRHRIRKPKYNKNQIIMKYSNKSGSADDSVLNSKLISTANDVTIASHNSSQELGNDKLDMFDKENQTIEALLSQWEEEEIPESELAYKPKEVPCFNSNVIAETDQIFQPVTAVPVTSSVMPTDSDAIIVELGGENLPGTPSVGTEMIITRNGVKSQAMTENVTSTSQNHTSQSEVENGLSVEMAQDVVMAEPDGHEMIHGAAKSDQFLPVEGGYILVGENGPPEQELPDLDEIERELKMLDEQILKMAQTNNIDAQAVLASTETCLPLVINDGPPVTESNASSQDKAKLFPIFSKPNPGVNTPLPKGSNGKKSNSIIKTGIDQYVIDAGQKKFGATQCSECGTIYQIGDPQDEHDHLVHHNATDVLRFNGWKEECVIERYGDMRIIRVRGGDSNWRRVETLLARVVHPQLGYDEPLCNTNVHSMTAYLCIEKRQIVGCLIAETKTKAYKLIPGEPDCCSVEDYPVKCGVSRVWTAARHRRRGVARRLLDCARARFLHGAALRTHDVAFSAPTPLGKAFATNYCGTHNFYVYLD